MSIHPLSLISPQAHLGQDLEVGPFSVIEAGARIGDGCQIGSHVVIKERTTLGKDNEIGDGAILGGLPQHLNAPPGAGRLEVGDHNVVRENVTLHRSLHVESATRLGDHNLIMVGAHAGHDCQVGNRVILANNVLLGGHVEVEDRAYVGGAAAVHQFCRIGAVAMVGGYGRIVKDVPPFVTVDGGTSRVVGLNLIGLKRAGYSSDQIRQLKQAYRVIYRNGLTWNEVLRALKDKFTASPGEAFVQFFSGGTRGFVQERRLPASATLRLHRDPEAEPELRTKAG